MSSNNVYSNTRNDLDALSGVVRNMQYNHNDDLARVHTIEYRGLIRIHQLLISFTPYIPMTAETHSGIAQICTGQ